MFPKQTNKTDFSCGILTGDFQLFWVVAIVDRMLRGRKHAGYRGSQPTSERHYDKKLPGNEF